MLIAIQDEGQFSLHHQQLTLWRLSHHIVKSAITTATKHPITLGFSISCDPLQKIKRTYVPFYHSCWWSCKQSDVRPLACRSLKRMEDDNSRTAGLCNQWTIKGGVIPIHKEDWVTMRIMSHICTTGRWLPDTQDGNATTITSLIKNFFGSSSGDFCKVFVRLGRSK